MNARQNAYNILTRIDDDGAYSHLAVETMLSDDLSARDRNFVTRLVYETLLRRRSVDMIISRFSKRKIRDIQFPVLRALRMGVTQLVFFDRVPQHAVVSETVELAKRRDPNVAGYVNGVMRAVTREENLTWWNDEDKTKKKTRYLGQRYSVPNWLANRFDQIFKDDAERQLDGFAATPDTYGWLVDDAKAIAQFEPVKGIKGSFRVSKWDENVDLLVREEQFLVQDLGSQLIGYFCGDVKGKRVLDGCTGLGTKALFLARQGADVVAVEPNKSRLKRAGVRGKKLGFDIEWVPRFLENYSTETLFDTVVVDAPCSGIGVIRRHPEVRWTRNESDVQALVRTQKSVLKAAFDLTKPGGELVYAVCTLLPEETHKMATWFAENFEVDAIAPPETELDWSEYTNDKGHLWLTPADHNTDGFFAARFRKR